mmetsp:Transcript_5109/g.12565  ORF Transcript_5109/g.12565 Transcript_5109/m.12565 type:complete len:91 (+) Transcript_5109:2416-2688(+)
MPMDRCGHGIFRCLPTDSTMRYGTERQDEKRRMDFKLGSSGTMSKHAANSHHNAMDFRKRIKILATGTWYTHVVICIFISCLFQKVMMTR